MSTTSDGKVVNLLREAFGGTMIVHGDRLSGVSGTVSQVFPPPFFLLDWKGNIWKRHPFVLGSTVHWCEDAL